MNINFKKLSHDSSLYFNYSCKSTSLQHVSEYKYLGLLFASKLSWSEHIEIKCNQALRKLGYLCRTLCVAPTKTKLITYKTFVRPVLEYAATTLNPNKVCDIDGTESVQKKAVRFIYCHYDRTFSPSSHWAVLGLTRHFHRRL